MAVLASPSVRCDWSRPKVWAPWKVAHCAVAQDDDEHRGDRPPDAGAVLLQRLVMGHLIGRVAQLEIALLLHPVDEIVVLLDIGAEQLLLHRRVLDHDEVPRLPVGARHRPASDFEDAPDVLVGDGIGFELADAGPAPDQIEQHVVVAGEVRLIHFLPRPYRLMPYLCGTVRLSRRLYQ